MSPAPASSSVVDGTRAAKAFRFGAFSLDPLQQRLMRDGHPIPLTPKAFQTLVVLVSRAGQLVDKDELLSAVWPNTVVEEIGLAKNVSTLRRVLGDTASEPLFIETVSKRGYRFVAQVHTEEGAPQVPSIAVLPLSDFSTGERHEFLADALTDAFTTEIARLPFLKVLSGTTAMVGARSADRPASEFASRLNVQYVLEGSLQRLGELLRVAVRLVDAGNDRTVWSGSFERQLGNWHAIQLALSQAVARELRLSLRPEDRTRLAPTRPVDGTAYEEYLRARFFLLRRTNPALRKAYEGFSRVTQMAPDFAPAYGGITEACVTLFGRGLDPCKVAGPRAKAAARIALELEPALAEPRAALAVFLAEDGDLDGARREFEQAVRDEPNYAIGYARYAEILRNWGLHDEARVQIEQALSLEPLSLPINTIASEIFRDAGEHDRAMDCARKSLELDPTFHSARWQLGVVLLETGRVNEAIDELQLADEHAGGNSVVRLALATAYVAGRREAEADRVIERLTVADTPAAVFLDVSRLEFAMGHQEHARAALARGWDQLPPRRGPLPNFSELRGHEAVTAFDEWSGRTHNQQFLPRLPFLLRAGG